MKYSMLVGLLFSLSLPAAYAQTSGLEVGQQAPEITLPNPQGNSISLSDFRGKLVLIDFWASWCAPCVKEQPHLAELYKQYRQAEFSKGTGFEIVGVSLDSKKEAWQNRIEKMQINWPQMSDLKFWASPVARLYQIEALPFNVLIDEQGIIIAKDLHGEELDQALEKLLKK